MQQKRSTLLVYLLLMCFLLSSCTTAGSSLPITELEPQVTLPPAEVSYVAPIGDAALEYTAPATLYLPSHDGISLTAVETEVSYSPVRPHAESLVRVLLSQAATKDATTVGGDVRLSLYGTSPVEVSRDVATINLSASALQLNRQSLYLACQAIANTLTQLPEISYVNFLVVDKPVGLDILNTLPMGALKSNPSADLGAVYEQLFSRRVGSDENAADKPFSANVTLYFPLNETEGMVSEVRSMSFENQVFSDMVIAILRELAAGPSDKTILSPALPLLADLLTTAPTLESVKDIGGNIIRLDFAHNLDDMLEAYGISRKQSLASLCYTLTTFFPNVSGIHLSINGAPIETELLSENDPETVLASEIHLRPSFSAQLYDYCTLYFVSEDEETLAASRRPVHYYLSRHPRTLLNELSKGPQSCDSQPHLLPLLSAKRQISDTMMLGFALSDTTLLVNLAPTFDEIGNALNGNEERLLAYAMVNTLCMNERIKSICFFRSGSQFEGFSGDIYWAGLFYPLPY